MAEAAFWRGKRVLLTGHTGFKGAWAALWLSGMGAKVTGLALPPDQSPSLYELAGGGQFLDDELILDLRDGDAVDRALAGRSFDLVLHMAAQPIVRTAIEHPVGTFATNVMGTAHLLNALRAQPALQAVVVVTSDKVYANADEGRPFKEADPLGGKDPYSASKAAAEIATRSFARSYFEPHVPVATARGGNVIGGGDFSRDRIVADIVRAVRAGEAVSLRHPEATRPWQHVLDCLAGYLCYLEALARDPAATPRALNFGPRPGGREVTVGELATLGVQALGGQPWRHEPDPKSLEAKSLSIDASLAKQAIGFESRLDAPAAVHLTMDWYRRQGAGEDPLSLCRAQIADYEAGR